MRSFDSDRRRYCISKPALHSRNDMTSLLSKAAPSLTVTALLDNLQLTTEFESSMAKKWVTPVRINCISLRLKTPLLHVTRPISSAKSSVLPLPLQPTPNHILKQSLQHSNHIWASLSMLRTSESVLLHLA